MCVYTSWRFIKIFSSVNCHIGELFNYLPTISGPLFQGCCHPSAMSCSFGQLTLYPHLIPWELQIPFLLPSPSHRHALALGSSLPLTDHWAQPFRSSISAQCASTCPHSVTSTPLSFLLHPDFQLLLSPYAAKTNHLKSASPTLLVLQPVFQPSAYLTNSSFGPGQLLAFLSLRLGL